MEEAHDKAPGKVPAEDGPAGGEIIERYGITPLWHREVKKKHVKKLKAAAEEEGLQFVHGRTHRKG